MHKTLYPILLPLLAEVLIFHADIFFFHSTWDALLSHLLEVYCKSPKKPCTYGSWCTHGTHTCTHTCSPLLPHTRLLPLYTSPICVGAIMCPPLIPVKPHTLSKTTFIPQCTCIPHVSNSPTMPSVYRPTTLRVPVRAHRCHLSLLSLPSAPHFGDTHIIYFMTENSI